MDLKNRYKMLNNIHINLSIGKATKIPIGTKKPFDEYPNGIVPTKDLVWIKVPEHLNLLSRKI